VEWLIVQLYVGCRERIINKDRVVTLDSDGQSLEQVGHLANITGRRTPSPTHLAQESDAEGEIEARVLSATGWKRKLWDRLAYLASFREVALLLLLLLGMQTRPRRFKVCSRRDRGETLPDFPETETVKIKSEAETSRPRLHP